MRHALCRRNMLWFCRSRREKCRIGSFLLKCNPADFPFRIESDQKVAFKVSDMLKPTQGKRVRILPFWLSVFTPQNPPTHYSWATSKEQCFWWNCKEPKYRGPELPLTHMADTESKSTGASPFAPSFSVQRHAVSKLGRGHCLQQWSCPWRSVVTWLVPKMFWILELSGVVNQSPNNKNKMRKGGWLLI